MIWLIGSYISVLIFIFFGFAVFKKLSQANKTFQGGLQSKTFQSQELIDQHFFVGNWNKMFKNDLNSSHLIDQYMISYEDETPYLLCHFKDKVLCEGVLELCCYGSRGDLLYTYVIDDIKAFKDCGMTRLPQKTAFVNLHYHVNSNEVADYTALYNQRFNNYRQAAMLESVALFFLFIPIGNYMLTSLTGPKVEVFRNFDTFAIGVGLMLFACLVNYIFMYGWIRVHHPKKGARNEII